MYRAVVHGEAVKLLLACTARERQLLLRLLDQLESNPFRKGDFEVKDETGRMQQVTGVAGFLVTYYADHAVKEVRVTEIE
jgi:hypothetical protein